MLRTYQDLPKDAGAVAAELSVCRLGRGRLPLILEVVPASSPEPRIPLRSACRCCGPVKVPANTTDFEQHPSCSGASDHNRQESAMIAQFRFIWDRQRVTLSSGEQESCA